MTFFRFKRSAIVAAKYDGIYYRAKVTGYAMFMAEVQYLDYGNCAKVSNHCNDVMISYAVVVADIFSLNVCVLNVSWPVVYVHCILIVLLNPVWISLRKTKRKTLHLDINGNFPMTFRLD